MAGFNTAADTIILNAMAAKMAAEAKATAAKLKLEQLHAPRRRTLAAVKEYVSRHPLEDWSDEKLDELFYKMEEAYKRNAALLKRLDERSATWVETEARLCGDLPNT